MTYQEYRAIVKIHGKDFSFLEIPTYIRRRDNLEEDKPDKYQEFVDNQLTS